MAAALALLGLLLPVPAGARTWRVERDGSGDFSNLQTAVNSVASGDTILIGPGRYTEVADYTLPGWWTGPTYVGIARNFLTLIGTNRDAVIIGPDEPDFQGFFPMGIVTNVNVTMLTVENLSIENVRSGMYLLGRTEVRNLRIEDCDFGIVSFNDGGLVVEDCEFRSNGRGIAGFDDLEDALVTQCRFIGNSKGAHFARSRSCTLTDCEFQGGGVSLAFEGADGVVERCTFTEQVTAAISLTDGAHVTLNRNTCVGGQASILIGNFSHAEGSRNLFADTTVATIYMTSGSTASLHASDILPAEGDAFWALSYLSDPVTIDLTGNYWGTADADSIEALILDGNDDPSVHAFVEYEPFEPQSVPNAKQSVGGLKSLFGRRR